MKLCARCEKVKPESAFHNDRSSSTGLQSYCIKCHKELTQRPRYRRVDRRKRDSDPRQLPLF